VLEQPDDLTFYVVGENAVPLSSVLADRCGTIVAGDSRFGSIRPRGSSSNAYTLEAFAAIKVLEMADARAMHVDYIACQLRAELDSQVLRRGGVRFGFPRTECLLGLEDGSVRLDRRNLRVVRHLWEFPGYFLDQTDMRRLVDDLLAAQVLTPELVRATGLANRDQLFAPRHLKGLVPFILGEGPLGARLREGILTNVGDGVYSSVCSTSDYERRALHVLNELGAVVNWY
jgi:hypothetical protein